MVFTVMVTGLIGFTLASYLSMVQTQNQANMRSQAWNATIPVIEAGIEDALTHLNEHASTGLGVDGWNKIGDLYWIQRFLGDSYYIVTISNYFGPNSANPVVRSIGYVPMPTQVVSSKQTMFANVAGDGTTSTSSSANANLARGVMVTTGRQKLFVKGLVSKEQIDLNGNNIETDSFDSADPLHSNLGQYDATKRKYNGDVATNSGLINSVSVGNANIRGKVSTGPGGSVSIGRNGIVGGEKWYNDGRTGIQPGFTSDDMNVDFPEVKPPFTGGGYTPGAGIVGGQIYDYVLGSGNYQMSSLTMASLKDMIVTGDATLYVTGDVNMSGSAVIEIANGGSLKLYVAGRSAKLTGNGVVNHTGFATNFIYYGMPSNTSLAVGGNGEFVGIVYAPQADFDLSGSGSSDNDFIGASVSKTATLNGHYKFHYDEDLANFGPNRGFIVTTWDEMEPYEVTSFHIQNYYTWEAITQDYYY